MRAGTVSARVESANKVTVTRSGFPDGFCTTIEASRSWSTSTALTCAVRMRARMIRQAIISDVRAKQPMLGVVE